MTYDFTNQVTTLAEPADPEQNHTRYLVLYPDSVAVTTITGLVDLIIADEDEGRIGIVVISSDCSSEAIQIEREDDGTWIVTQSSNPGHVIEEIRWDGDDVVHHEVYTPGFTGTQVPYFQVGVH